MPYTDEDVGMIVVALVIFWIILLCYILTFIGLSELQTAGVLVPLCIGSFVMWVRHENAKIRKSEAAKLAKKEAAAAAEGSNSAAPAAAAAEAKKDK